MHLGEFLFHQKGTKTTKLNIWYAFYLHDLRALLGLLFVTVFMTSSTKLLDLTEILFLHNIFRI